MSVIDRDILLGEMDEDAPCGPDLEYDAAFIELEQAAQGKPEQQVGDTITPAEEPDWRGLHRRALELSARTRDLRVWLQLARASLHTDGLSGLHEGLRLFADGIERYWGQVHPQLDPDDDNDPTLRVNVLMSLCDAETMLRDLRHVPLVESPALGRFSLHDIAVAEGRVAVGDGDTPVQQATVDAAFRDAGADALQATLEAAEGSVQCLQSLERMVTEQVGVGAAPNFAALTDLLGEACHALRQQIALHHGGEPADAEAPSATAPAAADGPAPAPRGGIQSRDDVIRVLDEACEYFQRHEPSSPVPILLRRARRLVHKDFMTILRDLVPDGVSQAETFVGSDEGED